MIDQMVEALIQVLGTILVAPLYSGIAEKLKGVVSLRRAQSVLQPYYDLFKLLKRKQLYPQAHQNSLFTAHTSHSGSMC